MRLFPSSSPILKLVRRGKWDAVEEMLLADDGFTIRTNCPTFIHQLLKHNPPVDIVDIALQRLQCPDVIVEEERDEKGRTPLHIAAAHTCDSRIIKLLLEGVSGVMPAFMSDKAGNTPLHAACNVNFDSIRRHSIKRALAAMNNATEIVTRLLQANPEAASLGNRRGETPLHLAKENNADARIIVRIDAVQQTFQEGGKIHSETFKTPLSSNEFSIVSRPLNELDASLSSVGFDEAEESEKDLLNTEELVLSTVKEDDEGRLDIQVPTRPVLLSL